VDVWRDPDDAAWTARARVVDGAVCDVLFDWVDDVYYGPPDKYFAGRDKLRDMLPPPDLPRLEGRAVPAASLAGHEAELIAHYRRIVAIAEARRAPRVLREPLPCFRIQAAFHDGRALLTSPSWHDTEAQARGLLAALAGAENCPASGDLIEVYDDIDQGWHTRFLRQGDRLLVLEWNWEAPEDPSGRVEMSLDLAGAVTQARAALVRLRAIHALLVAALGRDYWNLGVVV
jgi:hypothetical protein